MPLLPGADTRTISDILVCNLSPPERDEFIAWSRGVKSDDYWSGISAFFDDREIKEAIAEYSSGQLEYLERFLGIRIDALIYVAGTRYCYGNFYEEMS